MPRSFTAGEFFGRAWFKSRIAVSKRPEYGLESFDLRRLAAWSGSAPELGKGHLTDTERLLGGGELKWMASVSPENRDTSLYQAKFRRLGVEQIDLYQMHAWDPTTPLEETLRFLHDSVTHGKIAYYGFSNFLGWQLTKAVHLAQSQGWNHPVTMQPQYSLLVREIELEVVPASLDANIGLLPWSPLGGGWLSGKYKRDVPPIGATRLGENPERVWKHGRLATTTPAHGMLLKQWRKPLRTMVLVPHRWL